jgi:hypothetical protein
MEQNIKTEIREMIFNKIEKLQREPQTIKKFFPFTMEDLNDDPEGCIEVIEDYLEQHKDKILDFEFESWIDESAMIPVLMLKMELVPSMSKFLVSMRALNNLLPSSVESDIMREEITEIFSQHQWEFNDEKTRATIANKLKYGIGLIFDDVEDRTTSEQIDKGGFNFILKKGDSEMTIEEYLQSIADKKRFED